MQKIVQNVPKNLQQVIDRHLAPDENVIYQLKGTFKEVLVCTDRRVIIAKSGFLTGQMFAKDIFELPYGAISSTQVRMGIMTGYFEVAGGGVQHTRKSYWVTKGPHSAANSPNSVSIAGRGQEEPFRRAAAFIMQQSSNIKPASSMASSSADLAGSLERLALLKANGALDEAEFAAAKAQLLTSSVGVEIPEPTETSGYSVTLMMVGKRRVSVMKIFRDATGRTLRDISVTIKGSPVVVISGINERYAHELEEKFASVGALAKVAPISRTAN